MEIKYNPEVFNEREQELINKISEKDIFTYRGYDELVGYLIRNLKIWEIRAPYKSLDKYNKKDIWSIIVGYDITPNNDRYFWGDTLLETLLRIYLKKIEIENFCKENNHKWYIYSKEELGYNRDKKSGHCEICHIEYGDIYE